MIKLNNITFNSKQTNSKKPALKNSNESTNIETTLIPSTKIGPEYYAGIIPSKNKTAETHLLKSFEPLIPLQNITPENFHRQRPVIVDANVYRGGRPKNEQGIIELKNCGIKRIVSFIKKNKTYPKDPISNWQIEKELAQKHGIEFIQIPLDERKEPTLKDIKKFKSINSEKDSFPYYFHCSSGQDRAGVMGAINDVDNRGLSYDEAYERMLSQNHNFYSFPNLDNYFYKYCLSKGENPEDMHPKEILEKWIDRNYCLAERKDKKLIINKVLNEIGV